MGGTPWHELFLDDAEIPVENVLFSGHAFSKLMGSYSLERTAAGAWVLGVAQAAFELARWLVYKAYVDADGTASRLESSAAKVYPDSPETRRNPLPTASDGILLAK